MSGIKTAALGEPGARSPEPAVFPWAVPGASLEPGYPCEHRLKTTAFKVPRILSKEGLRELLAESWSLLAEERTFALTI